MRFQKPTTNRHYSNFRKIVWIWTVERPRFSVINSYNQVIHSEQPKLTHKRWIYLPNTIALFAKKRWALFDVIWTSVWNEAFTFSTSQYAESHWQTKSFYWNIQSNWRKLINPYCWLRYGMIRGYLTALIRYPGYRIHMNPKLWIITYDWFKSKKDEPSYSIVRNHTCSNFMGGSAITLDNKSKPRQGFHFNYSMF